MLCPLREFSFATVFQGRYCLSRSPLNESVENFHPFSAFIHTHNFLFLLLHEVSLESSYTTISVSQGRGAGAVMVDNMGASLCHLFLFSDSVCAWRMNSYLLMMDYCLGHLYLWLDGSDISQFMISSHTHMAIWCPWLDAWPLLCPTRPPVIVFRSIWFSAAGGTAILQNARVLCYDFTIRACHNFYEASFSITVASNMNRLLSREA